jgi:hypothetical protein
MDKNNNHSSFHHKQVRPRMILKRSDVFIPQPPGLPLPHQNNEIEKKLKEKNDEIKKLKLELLLKNTQIKNFQKTLYKNKNKRDKKITIEENNKIYFDKIYKILNIILNYNNVKEYSLYGSFIENFLSKKKLENTILYIFLKELENLDELYGLLEILFQNEYILNVDNFDSIYYFSSGEHCIPYYNLEIDLMPGLSQKKHITLRIHSFNYLRKVDCSVKNIEINQFGINNIYNLGRKVMNTNIQGLNILKSLHTTMNKEVVLYNHGNLFNNVTMNKNLIENQNNIFKLLSTQNEYILKKWIIKGSTCRCIIDECSICMEKKPIYELECHHFFCLDCLHSHINHQSVHNKKCPLCRRVMILQ